MDIRIQEASNDDIDQLVELVLQFRNEHSRIIGGDKKCELSDVKNNVRSHLTSTKYGYLVAVIDSKRLVGYRSWFYQDEFYFTRELYVVAQMRKKGVARQLFKYFEEWILQKGQEIACISIAPQNSAMIKLARSEGYDIINTIELRKSLSLNPRKPRTEISFLGFSWNVL